MIKRRIVLISLGLCLLLSQAWAQTFIADQIQFNGLQRISKITAMSYLPIRPGQQVTPELTDQIIQDLYKTGFFDDVRVERSGSTLVIDVVERPVISRLVIKGNKLVKTDQLLKVLQQADIAEGYEYNRSTIKDIRTALLDQYYAHGKYNVRVDTLADNEKNNSVALYITISEGVTATIKQIHIIGNHAFSESTLVSNFQLSTPNLLSFFTHDDEYSSEKLEGDLESLRSYYMNRGYLKFHIDDVNVSLSPDRKHVYIVIKVTEGPQYHFSGFALTGNLILPRSEMEMRIPIRQGAVFSRQKVIDGVNNLKDAVGNLGYAKANVTTQNDINEDNKTIFVTYHMVPGQKIYIHHIYFTGNSGTNDFAFRRGLTQMEGGLISTSQIQLSKQQLQQLPYVKSVDVESKPVPGKPNEEDLAYHVVTVPAGEVKAGVGWSDVDGAMFNAGLNEQNVFGTGNSFGLNTSYSASMLTAQVSYFNPYYTKWGIGRGFSVYASRYNASAANIANYDTDDYGGAVNYSIPIAVFDNLNFSFGGDYTHLDVGSNPADIIENFSSKYGDNFTQIPVTLGWSHNSLNRAVFPTYGIVQNANATMSVPVSSTGSLEYYKLSYGVTYYHPLWRQFVLHLRGDTGYGGGYGSYHELPFFKNFFLGGMGSVRGYEANTIGPVDSNLDPIGGNVFFDSSVGVIFPNPLSKTVRTTWFVDAGNVYDTKLTSDERARNPDRNRVRFSSGIQIDWLSPMGLLNFSIAQAINPTKTDDPTPFQFTMGASF